MLRAMKPRGGGALLWSHPPAPHPQPHGSQPLPHSEWALMQPALTHCHPRDTGLIFLQPFASIHLLRQGWVLLPWEVTFSGLSAFFCLVTT